MHEVPGLSRLLFLVLAPAFWCIATPASAHLPVARLSTIWPPGAQHGTSAIVSITGNDLDGLSQLWFSHPCITVHPTSVDGTNDLNPKRFRVTIPAEVPPDRYEVRVRGRFGSSNPRVFVVGYGPQSDLVGTNRSVASAYDLGAETAVFGRCAPSGIDYFRVKATKGQRLLLRCETKALDSQMDAVLVLTDFRGREVARSRQGGPLDFSVTSDEPLLLKVHDVLFRGGESFFYQLSWTTAPWIEFIFPPCGAPGETRAFTLYGHNIPGGTLSKEYSVDGRPLEQLCVELSVPMRSTEGVLLAPSESGLDHFTYALHSDSGVSNTRRLAFASAPLVTEAEPNDQVHQSQQLVLPTEVAGQFYPRGDRDWFTFEAKKGEVYWVDVASHRLGLPTDPFVLIQRVVRNAEGEEQASDVQEVYDPEPETVDREFNSSTRDPAWRFEVRDTGTYRLQVRDLFNQHRDDPRLVYRLAIRNGRPDFDLTAMAVAPPPTDPAKQEALVWAVFLRRGETWPVKVLAHRRDGFQGEIELSLEDPPSGVSCSPGRIPAGKNSAWLMLTAADDAAGQSDSLRIVGRATVGHAHIRREARSATLVWNADDLLKSAIESRSMGELVLGVSEVETAPIAIAPVETRTWETCVAGTLTIPLQITRGGQFNEKVKLKAVQLDALQSLGEIEVDGKTNTASLTLDLTKQKLPAGTHTFVLRGQTQGKYRRESDEELKAVEIARAAAEVAAQQAGVAAGQAAEAAKHAGEILASTTKLAEKAAAVATTASEKRAAAQSASARSADGEGSPDSQSAATAEEASALAQLKLAQDAISAAERTARETEARAKEAKSQHEIALKRVKEAQEALDKTQAIDTPVTAFSTPIRIDVAPLPITLETPPGINSIEPGGQLAFSVTLVRRFGYTEPVAIALEMPGETKGISAATVTVPKDETAAQLIIHAAPDAVGGEYKCALRARLKLNGQDLEHAFPIRMLVGKNSK